MDVTDGVDVVRYDHVPSLVEVLDHVTELSDKGARLRMWVFEKGVVFSTDELRKMVEHVRAQEVLAERTAIVSAADLGFGLFRMFQAYSDDLATHIQVFRDEDGALVWLKADSAQVE